MSSEQGGVGGGEVSDAPHPSASLEENGNQSIVDVTRGF